MNSEKGSARKKKWSINPSCLISVDHPIMITYRFFHVGMIRNVFVWMAFRKNLKWFISQWYFFKRDFSWLGWMAINFCWLSSRSGSKIRRDIPTGNNSRPNTKRTERWLEGRQLFYSFLGFQEFVSLFQGRHVENRHIKVVFLFWDGVDGLSSQKVG